MTMDGASQVYGSNQVELAWTVIPVLIVVALSWQRREWIASVQKTARLDNAIELSPLPSVLVGIPYPALGVVTANELHVPVSDDNHPTPTFIELLSADTDHSSGSAPGGKNRLDSQPSEQYVD